MTPCLLHPCKGAVHHQRQSLSLVFFASFSVLYLPFHFMVSGCGLWFDSYLSPLHSSVLFHFSKCLFTYLAVSSTLRALFLALAWSSSKCLCPFLLLCDLLKPCLGCTSPLTRPCSSNLGSSYMPACLSPPLWLHIPGKQRPCFLFFSMFSIFVCYIKLTHFLHWVVKT